MLHIILTILKILGILILIVLGLIVFVLLSVLFIPISYRLKGKKLDGPPEGNGVIKWLFGLIWVKIQYKDGKADIDIRILGISIKTIQKFIQKIKKAKAARRKKKKQSKASQSPATTQKKAERKKIEKKTDTQAAEEIPKTEDCVEEKKNSFVMKLVSLLKKVGEFLQKILGIPSKVVASIRKFKLTTQTICDKIKYWKDFLNEDVTKEALRCVKSISARLIRHILPKKVKGYVKYGFDDPAMTGQSLGVLSLVTPLYQSKFHVIPVFEEKAFECDVYVKGRIWGCVLLKAAIDIYRSRAIKTTIKKFQHKEA